MGSPGPAAWYVISLRPQHGHAGLRRAAARHGARVLALSPWRIEARTDAGARAGLEAALAAPRVLFTSPAAVRAAAALQPLRRRRGQHWLAVGAGTAAALCRAGVADVAAPARMDSEGLLQLPALHGIAGLAVGLVTAPGGRGVIAATLRRRGARVVRAEVYRRVPVAPAPAAVARLLRLEAPACLALSSGEALAVVLEQLPAAAAARLRRCAVAAASARLAGLAQAHGFRRIVLAAGPRPAQLAAAAAEAIAG